MTKTVAQRILEMLNDPSVPMTKINEYWQNEIARMAA